MSAAKSTLRFGTQFMPNKRECRIQGPDLSVFKRTSLWTRSKKQASKENVTLFPTYSVLDACVSDKTALLRWQKEKIASLGREAFMKQQVERTKSGRRYHTSVENYLKKRDKQSLNEILSKSNETEHGFLQSVYPFLTSIPQVDVILEGKTIHQDLFYTGRFDAVLLLPDGPCLVDWKTSSERSSIAQNCGNNSGIKGLYGYPKQIVAYIAAFNNDPNYKTNPFLEKGKIVIAYDSGAEATVVDLRKSDLEEIFEEWKGDLKRFWNEVEEGKIDFICRF